MMRFLPVLVFACLACGLALALLKPAPEPEHRMEGNALPALDLPVLTGEMPQPPYLLNLFASWCAPCLAEHPYLAKVAALGVPVVGIGWKDSAENLNAWFAQHGNPYRAVLHDEQGRAGVDLGIRGVPESYVIGKDNKILYHQMGPLTPEILADEILPFFVEQKNE